MVNHDIHVKVTKVLRQQRQRRDGVKQLPPAYHGGPKTIFKAEDFPRDKSIVGYAGTYVVSL